MSDLSYLGGWQANPAAVRAVMATLPAPLFWQAAPNLAGSGAGQTTLLYRAFKDVNGAYVPYPAQKIGDCVSHGFGHGTDLLACVGIALGHRAEVFKQTATEAVYGMARVDIGGEHGSMEDGAVGAWAAKAVSTIGTVSRDVVGPYSGQRAKQWGADGVPADVQSHAGEHKVQTVSLVTSYSQLEDALANGYPVPVCSNQGFTMSRDRQGFCRPQGNWSHCMLLAGTRTDRPGALIMQSWGMQAPDGPLDLDQPPNSFWADRQVVESMLSMQDSWSLSSFVGYPGQPLPSHWKLSDLAR